MDGVERAAGLPRAMLVMIWLAAVTVVIAGLHGIASLVAPAFLALILTIGVHPVRMWLAGHRWPGWLQTVTVLLLVYGVLFALVAALVVSMARFAALLPSYQQDFNDLLASFQDWLTSMGVKEEQITAMTDAFDLGQFASWITGLLSGLLGVLSDLFFVVTLLLMLALDGAWLPRRLAAVPTEHQRFVDALNGFAHGTRTYLVVSTVFGGIVAVIDTVLLAALGVPVPLLWGLLAFITNYIPNIGFLIGVIPPAILALLEGGPGLMLAVLIGYSVINVVIQSVIQPKVMGDAVGLSTSLTFLSLVFWAWVFGALGALLAIPLSLFAKALLVDGDPAAGWITPLLSTTPEKVGPPADGRADGRPAGRAAGRAPARGTSTPRA